MKKCLFVFLSSLFLSSLISQSNIKLSNPLASKILIGDYNPADYNPTGSLDIADEIIGGLINNLKSENLKDLLIEMSQFQNRNTGSDTLSLINGIGAARNWAHAKFESYNQENGDRLIVSFLQFDREICDVTRHKNILAIIPGTGPQYDESVLIEAHFDSRCKGACDIICDAHGMEDNGSGSALVMELARVMSKYNFNRSIIFMLTIGEEQGLYGADAFSDYVLQNDINLIAVFNNDIVGGIACGETASPPGCPGLDHIDSTNVRLYSNGSFNSRSKSLARFTKLEYVENVFEKMDVKTEIKIMSAEDRVGRGGDHIPFRIKGFPAIRFTSANEHGDAGVSDPDYHDRQHTEDDILGMDTDGDMILDTFFVDFNYLCRNALINGNAAAMASIGPIKPVLSSLDPVPGGLQVDIEDPNDYGIYRIGIRTVTNDFDTVLTVNNKSPILSELNFGEQYFLSVAVVDEFGIESLFSNELRANVISSTDELVSKPKIELLQNRPNPFDDQTTISVWVNEIIKHEKALIIVSDISGKTVDKQELQLQLGMNEILYQHSNHNFSEGIYYYSLIIDGKILETKSMIYAY